MLSDEDRFLIDAARLHQVDYLLDEPVPAPPPWAVGTVKSLEIVLLVWRFQAVTPQPLVIRTPEFGPVFIPAVAAIEQIWVDDEALPEMVLHIRDARPRDVAYRFRFYELEDCWAMVGRPADDPDAPVLPIGGLGDPERIERFCLLALQSRGLEHAEAVDAYAEVIAWFQGPDCVQEMTRRLLPSAFEACHRDGVDTTDAAAAMPSVRSRFVGQVAWLLAEEVLEQHRHRDRDRNRDRDRDRSASGEPEDSKDPGSDRLLDAHLAGLPETFAADRLPSSHPAEPFPGGGSALRAARREIRERARQTAEELHARWPRIPVAFLHTLCVVTWCGLMLRLLEQAAADV